MRCGLLLLEDFLKQLSCETDGVFHKSISSCDVVC